MKDYTLREISVCFDDKKCYVKNFKEWILIVGCIQCFVIDMNIN